MAKVWSFNTTVRNPERMQNFLRALSEVEGQKFDEEGQKNFFGSIIKKRLYKPERITLEDRYLIEAVHEDETGDDIDDQIIDKILDKFKDKPVNASGRGRTPAGILNRFGLCIAQKSKGEVVITDLAKEWLEDKVDEEELFTKFLLKWQYPNPLEKKGYDDFDIRPFVGTLKLITEVNKKWNELGNKPVGLSKEEYSLFVPSLVRSDQIVDYVDRIINFRSECKERSGVDRKDFIKTFKIKRIREIFGDSCSINTNLDNLKDYTDSSIRYFRITGLIALRGGDTHIDIAKDKKVEVDSIISNIKIKSDHFDEFSDYFSYLNDFNSLKLPWVNSSDHKKIINELTKLLREETEEESFRLYLENIKDLNDNDKVSELKLKLNNSRINKLKDIKHDFEILDDCLEKITLIKGSSNYSPLTSKPSLDFEWYVSRALLVINDALSISPSFKMGDDGLPTGFRANVSDIECYYESFNMIVEVTLLSGRDQWYAEGQPVMRHLKDFDDKNNNKTNYCIFVAPYIHRDTLNTFWGSIKTGYEGSKQNILPLTVNQFIDVLKIFKKMILENKFFNLNFKELLDVVVEKSNNYSVSQDWLENIPKSIVEWSDR